MGTGILMCGLNGAEKSTLGRALAERLVRSRAENTVEEWAKSLSCPIIRVDGTKPVEENITFITEQIDRRKK